MNIQHLLRDLSTYYDVNRAVGHTTAMIQGAANTPRVEVLAVGLPFGRMLRRMDGMRHTDPVGLGCLDRLRGRQAPLLIDNSAQHFLFRTAAERIANLEAENQKLHDQLMRRRMGAY